MPRFLRERIEDPFKMAVASMLLSVIVAVSVVLMGSAVGQPSTAAKAWNLSVSATSQTLTLGTVSNSVAITNDGTTALWVNLGGTTAATPTAGGSTITVNSSETFSADMRISQMGLATDGGNQGARVVIAY